MTQSNLCGQNKKSGLTLVLSAAEGAMQMALAEAEGRLIFGSFIDAPSRGVEILTPALESAFSMMGREVHEISRIAVVRGPGSFTGIRLTATTAAGLARAVSARQAGLDYMDCIARQCLPFLSAAPSDAQLWILVRARRDLVYIQAFRHTKGEDIPFRALTDLDVLPVTTGEATERILSTATMLKTSRILLAGSGARENRDSLIMGLGGGQSWRTTFLDVIAPWPDTLLQAANEAQYGDADIDPLYVRGADAETNLPDIAHTLGLDPEAAVATLHRLTHAKPQS